MSDSSDSETKVQLKMKLIFLVQEYLDDVFTLDKEYSCEDLIEVTYQSLYDSKDIILNLWKKSKRIPVGIAYSSAMRTRFNLNMFDESTIGLPSIRDASNYLIEMYFIGKEATGFIDCSPFLELHKDIIREVNKVAKEVTTLTIMDLINKNIK